MAGASVFLAPPTVFACRSIGSRRNGTRAADLKGYNERSQNKSQIYGRYTRPCIPGPTILSTVPPLSGLNFPPLSQQRKYLPIYCPKLSCSYYIRLVIVEIYIQG